MPSPYLHAITCSKCGAALDPGSGERILVCPYCQTSHVFAPPPPAAASPRARFPALPLAVGTALLVASSGALLAFRGVSAPSPATTQRAGTNHGDPSATYAVGQNVDIHWGSSWWPGRVLDRDGTRYRITYDGWASSWDEWVQADRLRSREQR